MTHIGYSAACEIKCDALKGLEIIRGKNKSLMSGTRFIRMNIYVHPLGQSSWQTLIAGHAVHQAAHISFNLHNGGEVKYVFT